MKDRMERVQRMIKFIQQDFMGLFKVHEDTIHQLLVEAEYLGRHSQMVKDYDYINDMKFKRKFNLPDLTTGYAMACEDIARHMKQRFYNEK